MNNPNKILSVCTIILNIIIVVLAIVQLTGYCDNAINVFEPLIGVVLLLQAIQNWKKNRTVAIVSLCASLFIFGVAIAVFVL